ncbi:MAG: hypothetical protein KatS3mg113_0608 [Planctomycetaceae bacterium]|nr:MAG: hypothetical protein KatS3mg113_0608 [Planctomycetaceae bacterium]
MMGLSRGIFKAVLVVFSLLVYISTNVWAQFGPTPIVVARVVQRDVQSGQTYVGTVEPWKRSAVGSAVDGRVAEYPIEVGQRVRQGQTLCQLLTETIRLQVAAAEAELRLREEELRELENGSRPEEIAQAQARVEALAAQLEYAQARLKRFQQLALQGQTITQDQLDQARSAALEAERMLTAEQQTLQLLLKGPREERVSQARARRDAQAETVAQLKDQFKKHTMIAPFDGYIVAKRTELGEWITRGQVVAEVVYLDEVEIEAFVLETQVDAIHLGAEVRVELSALRGAQFIGKVVSVSPQGDVRSRTFPVRVRVQNEIRADGPRIKAGMLARVTLAVGEVQQALLVPKDALVLGGPTPMVYVVTPPPAGDRGGMAGPAGGPPPPPGNDQGAKPERGPAGSASATPQAVAGNTSPTSSGAAAATEIVRPVPVTLGVADGNLIQVSGELKAGDRVVIMGNERLRPMAPVIVTRDLSESSHTESSSPPASR